MPCQDEYRTPVWEGGLQQMHLTRLHHRRKIGGSLSDRRNWRWLHPVFWLDPIEESRRTPAEPSYANLML